MEQKITLSSISLVMDGNKDQIFSKISCTNEEKAVKIDLITKREARMCVLNRR